MSRQHISAARQRSHSAGQQKIVHYCSCGRAIRGNPGWWSHQGANPDHHSLTYTAFLDLTKE